MADNRKCEQCGILFTPRREHARFCSVRCRVAWNRENRTDPTADMSALEWSVIAMRDVTRRLPRSRAWDRPRAFAVIGEAVWWVTIVDATLVRHHLDIYDGALAARPPAERRLIEGTLGGLRFVRNRMGHHVDHVDFIHPEANRPGDDSITGWTWKPVPEPPLASLPPRGQEWETARHQAYQSHLAGHAIGEVFGRAAAFLSLTAAKATAATADSAPAAAR